MTKKEDRSTRTNNQPNDNYIYDQRNNIIDTLPSKYQLLIKDYLEENPRLDDRLLQIITGLSEDKKQLEEISVTDALTGMYNRRKFNDDYDLELKKAERYNQNLSLIMFDIDLFKQINDKYGHHEGDKILSKIGQYVPGYLRETDVNSFYRYGGEEFAGLFPNLGFESAVVLAERVREGVESDIGITISLGIADKKISANYPLKQMHKESDRLFLAADSALYQAKENGRNQVRVYTISDKVIFMDSYKAKATKNLRAANS